MTADSPELVGDRALILNGVENAATPLNSVEDSFLFVAHLGCMNDLSESIDFFKQQIDSAIRGKLLASLSRSQLFSALPMWFGFRAFCKKLTSDVHPGLRDAYRVEFMLKHLTVEQMFDQSMNWHRLRSLSLEELKLMGEKFGGEVEFSCILRRSYLFQRRLLARELLLKSLPTMVLVVSSIIAVALALVFTRSLTTGQ